MQEVTERQTTKGLLTPLRVYTGFVALLGLAVLGSLVPGIKWDSSVAGDLGLFIVLIIVAGSFPLRVAPAVVADLTTTVVLGAAMLLEPGVAIMAAVTGVLVRNLIVKFFGQKLHLPGYNYPYYKYPFNLGEIALTAGLTSLVFHAPATGDGLLTYMIVPAVACMYLVNTSLVSVVVSLELRVNPLRIWWMGTKQDGATELGLFAFGLIGAVVYRESPWIVAALVIPVAILYIAFSKLANKIAELEWTKKQLQKSKDELEVRVAERTAELSTTAEQLMSSRRRIVNNQEELRKGVAQQLHGPVQNRLLVATHWLHTARKAMGPEMAETATHIEKAANLIDTINQDDLRSVVRRLHPSLIRVSLEASLRSMVSEFQRSFNVMSI